MGYCFSFNDMANTDALKQFAKLPMKQRLVSLPEARLEVPLCPIFACVPPAKMRTLTHHG